METIKNYLDNMFVGLPKTDRIQDLKSNLLSNMEEKYNELKSQGKSENEAIGIVISEFGNIDELISELGIQKNDVDSSRPMVTEAEVESYLKIKKTMGIQIGIGVFLCILAPAMLILLSTLFDDGTLALGLSDSAKSIPGLIVLFILITIAVAIFIYSGMNFERYKYMEEGVTLPGNLEVSLKQQYDSFIPSFYVRLIMGVCLIVLSPISLFISNLISDQASPYGVVIMLILIAVSVNLFITYGVTKEAYERLLKIGDYTTIKKEDKVIGAVATIVWPLAVLIFLFFGFVFHAWHISWIVFPITGILFGMFSGAYSIITSNNTH